MCVIFTGSAREILAVDGLERAYDCNSDAWGVSWAAGGKVHVRKRGVTGNFKEAADVLKRLGDAMVVLHFRIATSGTKCDKAAHPFILGDGQAAFAHNGIISRWGDEKLSDTMQLVKVLNAMANPHGPAARLLLRNLIEQGAGRFAVQSAEGDVLMYGNWEEVVKEQKGVTTGVFASNTFWKNRVTYGTGRYRSWDIDDEYSAHYSAANSKWDSYERSHPMRDSRVSDRMKDQKSWAGPSGEWHRYTKLFPGVAIPPEGSEPIKHYKMDVYGRTYQMYWLPPSDRGVQGTGWFECPVKDYWDAIEDKDYKWKDQHREQWSDRRAKVLGDLWQKEQNELRQAALDNKEKGAGQAGAPFHPAANSNGSGTQPQPSGSGTSQTTSSPPLLSGPTGSEVSAKADTTPGPDEPTELDLLDEDDEFAAEMVQQELFEEDADKAGLTCQQLLSLGFTPDQSPIDEEELARAALLWAEKNRPMGASVLN